MEQNILNKPKFSFTKDEYNRKFMEFLSIAGMDGHDSRSHKATDDWFEYAGLYEKNKALRKKETS